MSIRLLCSTGAFTRHPQATDHRRIVAVGPTLDVDGLELVVYSEWYSDIDTVVRDLQRSALVFPAVHAQKKIGGLLGDPDLETRAAGLRCFSADCAVASSIGARVMVLHLWDLPSSDRQLDHNLSVLDQCVEMSQANGLELAVETIPCAMADPLTNVRRVLQHDPRARVALDTEFLAMHGQLEQAMGQRDLWQAGAILHIHLKDYDGTSAFPDGFRRYLHPGEGRLDFEALIFALKSHEWSGNLSLEASVVDRQGDADVARLAASLAQLNQLVHGTGSA